MFAELLTRPRSTPNFIRRNIDNCGDLPRVRSAPTRGLGVCGVPLILRRKEKEGRTGVKPKEKNTVREEKINGRPKTVVNIGSPEKKIYSDFCEEPVRKPSKTVHFANLPSQHKLHSGVRRTSIKSKLQFAEPQIAQNTIVSVPPQSAAKKKKLNSKWGSNRKSFPLSITTIPQLDRPSVSPELYLQITGQSYIPEGVEPWETLQNRIGCGRGRTFEGLLHTMETSKPNVQLSLNGNTSNSQELDNSYHKVYQRHLQTLNDLAPDIGDSDDGTETPTKPRPKRKIPPKLEIKLGGNVQTSSDDIQVITRGLEEVSLLEELDNCGNLTPVITYNHVSTVSPLAELSTASPGGSSKSSRSPSPLLDIPNASGDKNTKRPPL